MISVDFSVVYQVVIFLVLWFILNRVLFRPYLALLEERERKTAGVRNETGDLEVEGERLKARYDERLAQAEAAGNVAKESIVRQAEREKERILNQARQEATSALENVRREVQLELDKERQRAVSEVAAVARDMVSKVLGRSLA